eukprot:1152622-Pelagomonas_calceolata.AAC.8
MEPGLLSTLASSGCAGPQGTHPLIRQGMQGALRSGVVNTGKVHCKLAEAVHHAHSTVMAHASQPCNLVFNSWNGWMKGCVHSSVEGQMSLRMVCMKKLRACGTATQGPHKNHALMHHGLEGGMTGVADD